MDLNFDVESGWAVVRRWRTNPKLTAIPLWIWSVNDTETDRYLAKQFEVTGYITKDDPKGLAAALEDLKSPQ